MSTHDLEDVLDTLAKNIVVARSALGITQGDLAKDSGISRATIAQLEAGEGDPKLSTLISLSKSLDSTHWHLLTGKNEMSALISLAETIAKSEETVVLEEGDLETVKRLLSSGTKKKTIKAAKIGLKAIEESIAYEKEDGPSGDSDSEGKTAKAATSDAVNAMAVGAAMGTTLIPGLGTLVGAALGGFLAGKATIKMAKNKKMNKQDSEQ
ncbi:transcriptional regulator, XRE family [Desulfatibacillum aliphaticivorans]|uniref:Transcriptional regulator, XRE family n=1 Tax=Desulfatibacillum aliphaticivorans TaxID=218208 RepID=B8FIR7_DESAL|nr:helix-turn-helix domain-containing protein [Desulfatibacillum aliphaticivorans]ACL04308.1 transcriptional regulator, XRE family [Desulfatibacillum aliphaticivorans]